MKALTTAAPSAPVPPVTTTWRSCSVCISTPYQALPRQQSGVEADLPRLSSVMLRSALRPPSTAVQVPQCRRIAEHDLEQFPEEPLDARIGRTGSRRPGGGLRHHLVVATVDGVDIEDARLAWLEAGDAPAHRIGAQIEGGIEDQHQAIVGARPFDGS